MVVINGLCALKEALVNKSADFSDRAEDVFVRHAAHTKGSKPPDLLFFMSLNVFLCNYVMVSSICTTYIVSTCYFQLVVGL